LKKLNACSYSIAEKLELIMENAKVESRVLEDVSEKNVISKKEWDELVKSNQSITKTLTVNKDNFRGEVTLSYFWDNGGQRFNFQTSQYRITRLNGQGGGNKANLNLWVYGQNTWYNASPDALWQDNDWHSYNRGGSITPSSGKAGITAQFIFDKSGNDPSGYTTLQVIYS
jgi:hypothetical protein